MGTAQRKESQPLGQKKPKERKKLDSDLSSLLRLRRSKWVRERNSFVHTCRRSIQSNPGRNER